MAQKARKVIRLLLVGGSLLTRELLRMALQTRRNLQIAGEVDNPAEAVEVAGREQPDVILLAVHPNDELALESIPALITGASVEKIITVFSAGSTTLFRRAVRLGSLGVVVPEDGLADLIKAIQCVHKGETWIDRRLLLGVIQEAAQEDPENASLTAKIGHLTSRERKIIQLIGNGLNNKFIAEQLNISERTVESHLHSIFRKLQLTNRTALSVFALRNDLLG